MSQIGNYTKWLENLETQERRTIISIIEQEKELALLNKFIKDNPLPFCIKNPKANFQINTHTTSILVSLINMINDGYLVLKDE